MHITLLTIERLELITRLHLLPELGSAVLDMPGGWRTRNGQQAYEWLLCLCPCRSPCSVWFPSSLGRAGSSSSFSFQDLLDRTSMTSLSQACPSSVSISCTILLSSLFHPPMCYDPADFMICNFVLYFFVYFLIDQLLPLGHKFFEAVICILLCFIHYRIPGT